MVCNEIASSGNIITRLKTKFIYCVEEETFEC